MNSKIQYILSKKSLVGVATVDYILRDNSDGNGAFISSWDEFKLGLQPGYAQLTALDTDPDFIAYLDLQAWDAVRAMRDKKLTECDWTQLGDSQLTPGVQASWLTYRQALRDITAQSDSKNITWPTKPV